MATVESQNALIYVQAAYMCECSLFVSSSLRVFLGHWKTASKPVAYPSASLSSHCWVWWDSFPKLDSEKGGGVVLRLQSHPSSPLVLSLSLPSPPPTLEVWTFKLAGLEERCKLPQWGPGRSPA